MSKDGLQTFTKSIGEKTPALPTRFGNRTLRPINDALQLQPEAAEILDMKNWKLSPEDEHLLKNIIHGEKWTREEVMALPPEEYETFKRVYVIAVNTLGYEDYDRFCGLLREAISPENKRDQWENNHIRILRAIDQLSQGRNRLPSRSEIAEETGLSRVTINKHMKEYHGSRQYLERQEEYLFMRERILCQLFSYACMGDIRAAKVFLDATPLKDEGQARIKNQQNNFIQINGTTVTEEQIRRLPPEQQAKLCEVLQFLNPPLAANP